MWLQAWGVQRVHVRAYGGFRIMGRRKRTGPGAFILVDRDGGTYYQLEGGGQFGVSIFNPCSGGGCIASVDDIEVL